MKRMALLTLFVLAACTSRAPSTPSPDQIATAVTEAISATQTAEAPPEIQAGLAAYIEDLVVYKQGLGVVAYFVLADEMGLETTAAGEANLSIRRMVRRLDGSWAVSSGLLYETTVSVSPDDFKYEEVGRGEYQRTRLIYSLGWIGFKEFRRGELGQRGYAELVFNTLTGARFVAFTEIAW